MLIWFQVIYCNKLHVDRLFTAPLQVLFLDVGHTCQRVCRNAAPKHPNNHIRAVHHQYLLQTVFYKNYSAVIFYLNKYGTNLNLMQGN